MKAQNIILAATFEKETEKAICLSMQVSWCRTSVLKTKSLWFPKSIISETTDTPAYSENTDGMRLYSIPAWFYGKMSMQNDWNGNPMELASVDFSYNC